MTGNTGTARSYDVIVIGAGAAGLMCAMTAGKRGRRVLVLDHSTKVGEKIRISGGGRCNFTNMNTGRQHFISDNPHFCVSALSRYKPRDFVALVEKHGIAYHEKALGQLFCDGSATQIIDMLLAECAAADVAIEMDTSVASVVKTAEGFTLDTSHGHMVAAALVIATGGLSIPKIGATGFGYEIARQFGLNIVPTRAALAPLTFDGPEGDAIKALAGVAVDSIVSCGKMRFAEALLFTHRGLSGPAILQISSHWRQGREIAINMAPGINVYDHLKAAKSAQPKQELQTVLAHILPKRLAVAVAEKSGLGKKMAELSDKALRHAAAAVNDWRIVPSGTEGYRTAEVTAGGVDTTQLSSKTFEAQSVPGLYFIGEVVDVTGFLGGYNFQWAWASGHAAGLAV